MNVLADSQLEIAVSFAEKEDNRFEGVDSYLTPGGVPFLRGSLAAFECRLEAIIVGSTFQAERGCKLGAPVQIVLARRGPQAHDVRQKPGLEW